MTTAQEWIQEFDLMYNNINSNLAPSLDDYEKSVFLTTAQEEIVKTLYKGGALGNDSFEATEQLRRSLDVLMTEVLLAPSGTVTNLGGTVYNIPSDVLYIVYEALINGNCCNKQGMIVIPTTHDDFYKTYHNPFRGPNSTRVLRLDIDEDTVELFDVPPGSSYVIRYLRRPYPIILTPIAPDSINGYNTPGTPICELDEALHRTILTTAVQLAISAQTR